MPEVHCYTSISYSYLDRARVLAESVRRHHPDWKLWLLMSDVKPDGFHFDIGNEDFDYIVQVDELGIPDTRKWIFGHDVVELCTAVKGPMMARLIDAGADAVVYLDPDTALFSKLDHVVDLLETHSIVLTPHVTQAESQPNAILDNEIGSLKHGVYNLGFVAVRNRPDGRKFAAWWRDRLIAHCKDDVPNGLFTDQRWCDLAPALFGDTAILRDTGYNVAAWNVGNRPISFGKDGQIRAGDAPLRFFHFTKVNTVGEQVLAHYSYGRPEVFELLRWYRERLGQHAAKGLPEGWWAFGAYADGRKIPRAHRRVWRERPDVRAAFPDPFATGNNTFQSWADAHVALPAE